MASVVSSELPTPDSLLHRKPALLKPSFSSENLLNSSTSNLSVRSDGEKEIGLLEGQQQPITQHQLASSSSGKANFLSSFINLVKTMMGAGMLALPFAMSVSGVIPGVVMLLIATIMSTFGVYLVVISLLTAGRGASFGSLAMMTYPKIAVFFEAVVAVKCLGVGISYMGIASNMIPAIIMSFTNKPSFWTSQLTWVFAVALLITPVVCMPRIDSLKYTSFLGLMSIAYMAILSVTLFFTLGQGSLSRVTWFAPLGVSSFRSFSIFIFALTCHQNIPSIQNEARDCRTPAMMKVVTSGTAVAVSIYLVFSLFSFATFGTSVDDNVIKSYPANGAPFLIARSLYAFLMIFSLPLLTFPCRAACIRLTELVTPNVASKYHRSLYWAISICIMTLIVFVASFNLPLGLVLGFLGATTGPIVCFILPGLICNKLLEKEPWSAKRISALTLSAAGIVVMGVSLTAQILAALGKL